VIFEEAQQIIESMRFPQQLRDAMRKAMAEVATDGEERLTKLWPGAVVTTCDNWVSGCEMLWIWGYLIVEKNGMF